MKWQQGWQNYATCLWKAIDRTLVFKLTIYLQIKRDELLYSGGHVSNYFSWTVLIMAEITKKMRNREMLDCKFDDGVS